MLDVEKRNRARGKGYGDVGSPLSSPVIKTAPILPVPPLQRLWRSVRTRSAVLLRAKPLELTRSRRGPTRDKREKNPTPPLRLSVLDRTR